MNVDLQKVEGLLKQQPQLDLATREGGERLRQRFAAFLAAKHPQILQDFLLAELCGPYEREQRMLNALSERAGISDPALAADLLVKWARDDEDAYELLNAALGGEE